MLALPTLLRSPAAKERILVTGGAGFIGTHLCKSLRTASHEVISLDLRDRPSTPLKGVRYVVGDARDSKTLETLISGHQITTVYHLAATVSVPLCQSDPIRSYSNNVGTTVAVLEACRKRLAKAPIRFVLASSAALYGDVGNHGRPLKELETASRFPSFYAAQKHASEKSVEVYHSSHGLPAMVFRFFNVYGPGQDPTSPYSGVISIFSALAKDEKPLLLENGGRQTRDFVSVTEIANALTSALQAPGQAWDAAPINLGSGKSTTIRDLAALIKELSGSRSQLIEAPARQGDVLHSRADISRAKEKLGFQTAIELSSGLAEMFRGRGAISA